MLKDRLIGLSYAQKRSIQILADLILLSVAMWCALYLRLGNEGWRWPDMGQTLLFLAAPLIAIPFYIRMGMYRAVMRHLGNDALVGILKAVTLGYLGFVLALLLIRDAGWVISFPRSALFNYWWLSLMLIGGLRLAARQYFMGHWFLAGNSGADQPLSTAIPIAIYGAGSAGNQLLASLRMGSQYKTVAFIDDDETLLERSMAGVPVYSSASIDKLIGKTGLREVFLAIPSATRARRREVLTRLQQYPLHVRSIPGLMDLASGRVKVDDLQDVDVTDLLGRDSVPPDQSLFERCIKGKSVMVTGAGGSIGSELCRQIIQSNPARIVLLEHSEFALYGIHAELSSFARSRSIEVELVPILASIRNPQRVEDVISAWGVQTLYHAAAYKHVPMVEMNVAEGIMNNVFGTLFAAQAAIRCQVEHFVLVSTDKAVRPTNVMGSTKRLAEMLLQALSAEQAPHLWGDDEQVNQVNRTRFSMVRFGNVLDSSGSVIPLFREQIRRGGPVTVTHPDITRYFMTIPEAAQLVIQAGAMGQGGDVFVLDMGEPVRIVDLARKMIMLSGLSVRDEQNIKGDIGLSFTGLRPGEKLYEELLIGNNPETTGHEKIFRANEVFLPWSQMLQVLDQLKEAVQQDELEGVRSILLSTVQGYVPSNGIVDLLYEQTERTAR